MSPTQDLLLAASDGLGDLSAEGWVGEELIDECGDHVLAGDACQAEAGARSTVRRTFFWRMAGGGIDDAARSSAAGSDVGGVGSCSGA